MRNGEMSKVKKVIGKVEKMGKIVEDINLQTGDMLDIRKEFAFDSIDIVSNINQLDSSVKGALEEIKSISDKLDELIDTLVLQPEDYQNDIMELESEGEDWIFEDMYRMLEDSADIVKKTFNHIAAEDNFLEELELV